MRRMARSRRVGVGEVELLGRLVKRLDRRKDNGVRLMRWLLVQRGMAAFARHPRGRDRARAAIYRLLGGSEALEPADEAMLERGSIAPARAEVASGVLPMVPAVLAPDRQVALPPKARDGRRAPHGREELVRATRLARRPRVAVHRVCVYVWVINRPLLGSISLLRIGM